MSRLTEAERLLRRRGRRPRPSVTATIAGRPIAWARTATVAAGRRVTPARYAAWKSRAAELLAVAGRYGWLEPPVAVRVVVRSDGVEITAVGQGGGERPRGITGDLDNYAKAALDALTAAGIIGDDDEVTRLEVIFE